MRKLLLSFCLLVLVATGSIGQVFQITLNQPDQLLVYAGNDTTICPLHEIILGGEPTVTGGTEGYLYVWSPAEGLDDPTSPNPVATISESTEYTLTVIDGNGCEAIETVNIIVDLCLGIELSSLNENLRIFPNPSHGKIMISGLPDYMDRTDIKVLNSLGKEVSFNKEFDNYYGDLIIDLEGMGLPKGIYFIRISSGSNVYFQKVQYL